MTFGDGQVSCETRWVTETVIRDETNEGLREADDSARFNPQNAVDRLNSSGITGYGSYAQRGGTSFAIRILSVPYFASS